MCGVLVTSGYVALVIDTKNYVPHWDVTSCNGFWRIPDNFLEYTILNGFTVATKPSYFNHQGNPRSQSARRSNAETRVELVRSLFAAKGETSCVYVHTR